jgi:hypothetical protein
MNFKKELPLSSGAKNQQCVKQIFHEGIFNWKYVLPKAIWSAPRRHYTILYYREWIFKYKNLHDFEGKVKKVYSVFSREHLSQKYLYLPRRSLQKR